MDNCMWPESVTLPMNIFRYSDLSEDANLNRFCYFPAHNHIQVELLYIEEGEMLVTIGETTRLLCKGDMVLFNAFEIHAGKPSEDKRGCSYLCLTFSADYFGYYSKSVLKNIAGEVGTLLYVFDNYYHVDTDTAAMGACMEKMFVYSDSKTRGSECGMLAEFFSLMTILLTHHYHPNNEERRRNITFITAVQKIVNESYQEPLTTSDVSARLYMTTSGFCQMFKKNFGCTFLTYLSRYRIQKAKEYAARNMPIAEIAAKVGFSDYCRFSKTFHKVVGVAPSVFFGKWKAGTPAE